MGILKKLEDLAKPLSQGPIPSFSRYHLSKAIEIIGEEGTIGRSALSIRLKIGTGAIRTLIHHLQKARLIDISKSGCKLTSGGYKIFKELSILFPKKSFIEESQHPLGKYGFGILIKNAAKRVNLGLEQRDAAVRARANGAITLVFKRGKLYLPPDAEGEPKEWDLSSEVLEIFNPEENDVVIISGADNEDDAEAGARAAAWTLKS